MLSLSLQTYCSPRMKVSTPGYFPNSLNSSRWALRYSIAVRSCSRNGRVQPSPRVNSTPLVSCLLSTHAYLLWSPRRQTKSGRKRVVARKESTSNASPCAKILNSFTMSVLISHVRPQASEEGARIAARAGIGFKAAVREQDGASGEVERFVPRMRAHHHGAALR